MFSNKTVVVTGGTDGIGKALVAQLLESGAKVSTCGRNQEKLNALKKQFEGKALKVVQADVSREEDCKNFIEQTLEEFKQIDVLINNAGISMHSLFRDVSLETMRRVMETNFWGSVYCTKFALESIIKNKGMIVGVSSIAGYRGLPERSGYSASKFALNGWLEALRTEMLSEDVHVMWVCPGFTASNIRNVALNSEAKPQGESPLDEEKLMTAKKCAGHILKAMKRKKRTLVLTFQGKETVFMNKFFPGWTDRLTQKFFFKKGKLIK